MSERTEPQRRLAAAPLDSRQREEIVRRYWMKGELTPLAIANSLAGQHAVQAA